MEQKPSVGRIVHYWVKGVCHAAIVSAVDPQREMAADLCVFHPLIGPVVKQNVGFDNTVPSHAMGRLEQTWHWPERA